MPVITRNQSKNDMLESNQQSDNLENSFTSKLKNLFAKANDSFISREKKIKALIEIYALINENITNIIQNFGYDKWKNFLYVVFNKIVEFKTQYKNGELFDINNNLVDNCIQTINKTTQIFNNFNNQFHEFIKIYDIKLMTIVDMLNNERPIRNKRIINYTESETDSDDDDDPYYYDDYDYGNRDDDEDNEDENEDEQDYDYDEDNYNYNNDYPVIETSCVKTPTSVGLTFEEKNDLNEHIQTLEKRRSKRNVARVNYAKLNKYGI